MNTKTKVRAIIASIILMAMPLRAIADPVASPSPLPVVSASPSVMASPVASNGVNLPLPKHSCKELVSKAFPSGKAVLNADNLGKLYASGLKLNGVVGGAKVSVEQLIQGYSDAMGCFITPSTTTTTNK